MVDNITTAVAEDSGAAALQAELIRVFSAFDRVQAIAVGPYLDEIRVFVLLDINRHDFELLDSLIEAEEQLHGKFPPRILFTSYFPVGDTDLTQSRYNIGDIIWRRSSSEYE